MNRILNDDDFAVMKATHYGLFKERKHPNDDVRRWLDDGEVVEFTDIRFNYSNAEFTLNHDKNLKLWFSQLWGFYLKMEDFKINTDSLYASNLCLKSSSDAITELDVHSFWNKVRGKKFKVSIPDGVYVNINFRTPKLDGTPWSEILDKTVELLNKRDYQTIRDLDLLYARSLYDFEEV